MAEPLCCSVGHAATTHHSAFERCAYFGVPRFERRSRADTLGIGEWRHLDDCYQFRRRAGNRGSATEQTDLGQRIWPIIIPLHAGLARPWLTLFPAWPATPGWLFFGLLWRARLKKSAQIPCVPYLALSVFLLVVL